MKKILGLALTSIILLSTLSLLASSVVFADPGVIRFRMLAVERYFDHTRMYEAVDLITELLNYPNWDNSTSLFESHIHLLTVADPTTLPTSLQPFYRGNSSKANLQNEIVNFLGQASEEEIVILYYCGHSDGSHLRLDPPPYTSVSQAELSSWLSSGGLPNAYVNVILDTCHSGYWINDGAGPCLLGDINVLAACEQAQSAWCWGCHTAFTDEGLIPGFGAATDANGDGWISIEEVFDYARPACIAYASSNGETQEPASWYGVCTGNVPIAQRDNTKPFPDFAYPTTTASIGDPKHTVGSNTYVTSSTPFTFTAEDLICPTTGIDFIEIKVEGYTITFFATQGIFVITLPDGPHTFYYHAEDNAGNAEPERSLTVIFDNTPPTVEVVYPPDGFVYGLITIQIDATDSGSGVDYVEYSLDESTWIPTAFNTGTGCYEADWDTTILPDGDYTIYARAYDNLGNEGTDPEPPEVTIVLLELATSFTDSKFNRIEELEVTFNEQKRPMYKVGTNPGTLYEIIEITNIGSTVTLPSLELDISIPTETDFFGPGEPAFELQGAKPVHIYLDGIDVTPTGKWMPDLNALLVEQPLAPGDTLTLLVHYEYAFKGNTYSASEIGGWTDEDYDFETAITSASGPSWIGTLAAAAGP